MEAWRAGHGALLWAMRSKWRQHCQAANVEDIEITVQFSNCCKVCRCTVQGQLVCCGAFAFRRDMCALLKSGPADLLLLLLLLRSVAANFRRTVAIQ